MASAPKRRGRIPLGYSEKSKRGKYLEEAQLAEELKKYPFELTMRAVCKLLRDFGDHDMAFVIDKMLKNENQIPEIKSRVMMKNIPVCKPISTVDSLSLLLDCKLTKHQYLQIRNRVNACGTKLLPGYDGVLEAKQSCRPNDIQIDEGGMFAFVKLQSLLDHTIRRIVEGIKGPILENQKRQGIIVEEMTLVGSYGMDGSTGHSLYKMNMCNRSNYDPDTSLFASSFIPLKINRNLDETIVWKNNVAQSTRLCRPVRLQFEKESPALILKEKEWIEDQIKSLSKIVVQIDDEHSISVSCSLCLTVIDGKVLAVLTGTKSYQTCPICGANPSQFNLLQNGNTNMFKPLPGRLIYGVSPLHCWIRFFEFLLHLGYRIELKTWRVKKIDQPKLLERKHKIQSEMQQKLGLKVDFPSANGSGTTNDGNTSRRAFENADTFADILGVDRKLVHDLRTILICFASQQPINSLKFKDHCQNVLTRYVSLYPWCYLTATLHKILVHGSDIISASILPVGMLGEEAAECRNKNYKEDRERFTRKMSRQKNMEDLFHRAMDTSDPLMSTLYADTRNKFRKKKAFPPQVKFLLLSSDIETSINITASVPNCSTQPLNFGNDEFFTDLDRLHLEIEEIIENEP